MLIMFAIICNSANFVAHPMKTVMRSNVLCILICLLCCGVSVNAQTEGLYVPETGKSVKPKMKVLAAEDRGGYECRYVEFAVEKDERIKAYLLVPDMASRSAKCPAVLMLHDHGARFDIGKEKLVRPIASVLPDGEADHIAVSAQQWIDKNFDGIYMADLFASLGYVVLVADALYWGERSPLEAQRWSELNYAQQGSDSFWRAFLGQDYNTSKGMDFRETLASEPSKLNKAKKNLIKELKYIVYDGQKVLYDSLYSDGIIWAEKMLRDDAASVNLLRSLPYVDKGNVGAFGFSMGAHRCWMLSAFCEDVKCGAALSWMTSLDRDERMKPSDFSMAVMPMREKLDFGDIGMFLAPKPMLFINGSSDHLFPKEKVEIAFGKLQSHYINYMEAHSKKSPAGSSQTQPSFEPLQTVFFNGGHHCGKDVQKTIITFFDDYLR